MATIYRPERGIFTYIRNESLEGPPPTPEEGETWYDPGVCASRVFNGTAWVTLTLNPADE